MYFTIKFICCCLAAAVVAAAEAAPLSDGDVVKLDLGTAGDGDGNPASLSDWNQVGNGVNASVGAGSVVRHGDGAVVDGVSVLVVKGNGTNSTGQNNDVNSAGWSGLAGDPYYNDEAMTDLVFAGNPNELSVTFSGLDTGGVYTIRVYSLVNESGRDVSIAVTDGAGRRSVGPIDRQTLYNAAPLSSNLVFADIQADASGSVEIEISSATFGVILNAVVLEVGSVPVVSNFATITEAGIPPGGNPYLIFDTDPGQHYEIQTSTNLLTGWLPQTMLEGTGGAHSWTNELGWSQGARYARVQRVGGPQGDLVSGALTINQTWSQEPSGLDRTADVMVPTGAGPFPVVIMLHGNGGTSNFIGSMGGRLDGVIRVAPNGYLTSWNISAEASLAPDVDFIRHLIALLKTYPNVDADDISLFGSSNGAGMVNRCLIELGVDDFHKAVALVSQMTTQMYHDGSFWFNSTGNNNYDQMITPAMGRKICHINGEADPLIPYLGGSGVGTTFMPALDSTFRFAQSQGYAGTQLVYADGVPGDGVTRHADIVEYAYLGGDVVHYRVIGGNHGLVPHGDAARDIAAAFLLQ